jgi:hypothetical protein
VDDYEYDSDEERPEEGLKPLMRAGLAADSEDDEDEQGVLSQGLRMPSTVLTHVVLAWICGW